jgi:hypothetical protein
VEVTNTMGAAELLRKYLNEADPDLLRSMVQSFELVADGAEVVGLGAAALVVVEVDVAAVPARSLNQDS